MKNRKVIVGLLLTSFCLVVIFAINNQVKKASEEEKIVKKLEIARDQLDSLLIKSCSAVINFNNIKEGLVSDLLFPIPSIGVINNEFRQINLKITADRSGYNFVVIRLRSTNPVFLKYDVSTLSIYLFFKKGQNNKLISCSGHSFHQ